MKHRTEKEGSEKDKKKYKIKSQRNYWKASIWMNNFNLILGVHIFVSLFIKFLKIKFVSKI